RLNAVSDLQIVEFSPRYYEDEDPAHGPVHKRLWGCATLDKLFPWMEYIVRFGWCSNGNSVWVQFLDRPQKRMAMKEGRGGGGEEEEEEVVEGEVIGDKLL
ncbi:12305_t:CDS:2, partial [Entrophospora sp. SA101]